MRKLPHRCRGIRLAPILTALIACGLLAGCENPTDSRPEPKCDHVDADGIVVELTGASPDSLLAAQWQGAVSGGVVLEEGQALAGVRVTFLAADSTRIFVSPACDEHSLSWTVADTSLLGVTAAAGERWGVVMTAKQEGETTIRFRILHGDHADFTSQPVAVSIRPHDGEHAEAEGLRVELGAHALATVWQGAATGRLEVSAGDSTHALAVRFLAADGDAFTPVGSGFALTASLDGGAPATVDIVGDWSLRLHGLAPGLATLTLGLVHDGHADFTAVPITVEVLAPADLPSALAVLEGATHAASWNYDGDRAPVAAGALLADVGETRTGLDVHALGPWITGAGHGDSHRDTVRLPNGRYRLECTVADPSVAQVAFDPAAPWSVRLEGLVAGSTGAVFRILDGEVVALQTSALPVVVVGPAAGDAQADYFFKKNGVRFLYVVDGAVVDQPAGCAAPANPGHLEVTAGEETDLYLLKYLSGTCGQVDVPAGRILVFRVADPGLVGFTNHPIHWGEKTDFHLDGLVAGTTTVRCFLLNEATRAVELVSPPLPVTVLAP